MIRLLAFSLVTSHMTIFFSKRRLPTPYRVFMTISPLMSRVR